MSLHEPQHELVGVLQHELFSLGGDPGADVEVADLVEGVGGPFREPPPPQEHPPADSGLRLGDLHGVVFGEEAEHEAPALLAGTGRVLMGQIEGFTRRLQNQILS